MDTFLFDELLITHDIWGSEVLSQTSLNPRLANEMTHEQAGERSHPERRSVHTVAASPPDVTQKAFVTPIASFESI
ncbi:hypothetical protein E8E12_000421 [Didymella heteroderae]|uniref:Uncharacterized protein n=1 Tax=Didymella heteroderae TaxID=1769908 RepID=A0A9P4WJS4_9PLEO|nr:hypothetical protein E8E12_000421 [Didymella heteroderae]